VSFKTEGAITVRVDKDGSCCETVLQLLKCCVPFGSPFEWDVFLCKVVEGPGYGGKVLDESAIEVSKA
ncbi:hypothetical protein HETIRDRAFT_329209, partial [Heterobasidion irregulare TC 32-1]